MMSDCGSFRQAQHGQVPHLGAATSRGGDVAVGHIAHSIQGSGAQLGGRRLALSCSRLVTTATAGDLSHSPDDLREVEHDYAEFRVTLTEHRLSVDRQLPGGPRA